MADKDYSNLARDIIEHTGGATNIIDLSHCATRLRFQLKTVKRQTQSICETWMML